MVNSNLDETIERSGAPSRSGRGPAWTFPKHTLEFAVSVPRALEEKNSGEPLQPDMLARALGYRQRRDWRFRELLRSANQYGLVQGTSSSRVVGIEKLGEDVVSPSSSAQRQQALVDSFRHIELFRSVEKLYSGKKIPEDEFFENTLVRDFQVPRDRVRRFIEVFTANLRYLNLFAPRGEADGEHEVGEGVITMDGGDSPTRVREFLDSCFVMMPFGGWFDRYYQDIYVPAIRAAGFEPMRSDELFTTGSVVEQIWEQVQKSTVLLADLSNKNANVFYELGLAHAATKPVILAARHIDDVPFDLRHLRVIIYDVNEPRWSEKLAKSVTDYLKNAKKEPAKSIPQPFRDLLAESDENDDDDQTAEESGDGTA
jgi:acyl carrier protein